MPITMHRAVLITASAAVLAWSPERALAQQDQNIQADCARIEEPTARLACYDSKNRTPGEVEARPVPPQSSAVSRPRSAPVVPNSEVVPGRDSARSPRPTATTPRLGRATPIVVAVSEKWPGAYLVTLADGAQWEFAEDMAATYRPPQRGSTVAIEQGVLGNYRMRFDGQQPVRVRRVR